MSERRRLKAMEVEVDGDSVWLHVGPGAVMAFTVPKKYGGADLITEPIPEDEEEYTASEPPLDKLKRTIETLSRVTDGHRRDMADDIQRLHHAVHVELEDRIEALEKDSHPPVRIPLGEIEARIEVLEARTANILADMLNPNPKEVMPDACDTTATEQPADLMDLGDVAARGDRESGGPAPVEAPARPPVVQGAVEGVTAAEQDAPGGDEPSVEEVLEWLEDIAGGWVATPGANQPGAAARIIREQREEIERLTERLTITPEKVKAAFAEQGKHHFRDHPAMLCILTAAGMIDPEVEG